MEKAAQLRALLAAISVLCLATSPVAADEAEFCADAEWQLNGTVNELETLDVLVDSDDYVGREFTVRSHVWIDRQNNDRITGKLGPLRHCFFDLMRATVDFSQSINFEITLIDFGDNQFRQARRDILRHTDDARSLALFEIEGRLQIYSNTFEPYLRVQSIRVLGQ